jgi:hypothetical protein
MRNVMAALWLMYAVAAMGCAGSGSTTGPSDGVEATLRCVATSATGSLSAAASGSGYAGTATLSEKTVPIRVVKELGAVPVVPGTGSAFRATLDLFETGLG